MASSSSSCATETPDVVSSDVNTISTLPVDPNIFSENLVAKCSTSFDQLDNEIVVPPPPQRIKEELSKYRKRLNKHITSLESAYFNQPHSIGIILNIFLF